MVPDPENTENFAFGEDLAIVEREMSLGSASCVVKFVFPVYRGDKAYIFIMDPKYSLPLECPVSDAFLSVIKTEYGGDAEKMLDVTADNYVSPPKTEKAVSCAD